jgi:hypothetical protein
MYTYFNRGYLWNLIYGVYCDILSKNDYSHMNARGTLSNDRTVKKWAVERCVH